MSLVTDPSSPTFACLFCGGVPLTKEHVMGQWLSNELRTMGVAEFTARTPFGVWKPTIMNFEAQKFCRACNTGRMSSLEAAVAPILRRTALRPERTTLTEEEQHTVATWLYKTHLVAIALHGHERHVTEEYAYFNEHWEPPPYTLMLMGFDTSDRYSSQYRLQGHALGGDDPTPDFLIANLSVLHAIFVTLHNHTDRTLHPPKPDAWWRQLWPIVGPLPWPPLPLSDDALAAVFPPAPGIS